VNDFSPIIDANSEGQGSPPDWHGSGCVLVVEDDDAVRTLVARALPRYGFTATGAGNGVEALAQLNADPDSYVLILLDIKIPGMSSTELVREIRKVRPVLPIIIMTGFDRDKALEGVAGTNLVGYIHKPFTLNKLASEIRNALGH
jgi:two-component system cell cycle sensor histidine kinase/response regulator CckA